MLPRVLYLFLINTPFPKFTEGGGRGAFIREGRLYNIFRIILGVYWRGAFKREWAFIREDTVLVITHTLVYSIS